MQPLHRIVRLAVVALPGLIIVGVIGATVPAARVPKHIVLLVVRDDGVHRVRAAFTRCLLRERAAAT